MIGKSSEKEPLWQRIAVARKAKWTAGNSFALQP
jgi:hypothetical protein